MEANKPAPQWKEISRLEFWGAALLISISVFLFDAAVGVMFRAFLRESSESVSRIFQNALYICFGTVAAISVYKLRKSYPVIICSFFLLFILHLFIGFSLSHEAAGKIIWNFLAERSPVYLALVSFVFLLRYSEDKLDFANVKDVSEKTDKKTKLKYDAGICSKCGGSAVVAKERPTKSGKKMEFVCSQCGRYIRGNPLPGLVLGLVMISISLIFLYGMNSGSRHSVVSTLNLFFVIVLFVGAKVLYSGIQWTYHSLPGGGRRNIKA